MEVGPLLGGVAEGRGGFLFVSHVWEGWRPEETSPLGGSMAFRGRTRSVVGAIVSTL